MIRVELSKQIYRVRTYALLGLMAGLPVLLTVTLKLRGVPDHTGGPGEGFVDLATNSGLNMALASLGHVGPLVLPTIVAVFAGSAIAEEANWRTLGYLLVRPISRGRFLLTKLAVVAMLIVVATFLALVIAVVAGVIGFGWHSVETPDGATIPAEAALVRVSIAALYLAWAMAAIAAVSFFVSTATNAPLNAVASGFGLSIISQLLDSFSAIGDTRKVLPTHYWSAWEGLFANPVTWDDMLVGSILQLPFVIVFLALAWWQFSRKDILT